MTGKITRTHLTEAKRTSGVLCVYKECFAELSAGAFKNHFEAQHLKECAPPVWNPEFHKTYSVGRRERARLAKFGLLDVFLQEDIKEVRKSLEEQGVLLKIIAAKLGIDVAPVLPTPVDVTAASEENLVVTPVSESVVAPETAARGKEAEEPAQPKAKSKKKRTSTAAQQQSPARKSARTAKAPVVDATSI